MASGEGTGFGRSAPITVDRRRWLILAAGAALAAWPLTTAAFAGFLSPGDAWLRDLVLAYRSPILEWLMLALSWLGSEYVIPFMLALVWLVLRRYQRGLALWVVGVTVTSAAWQMILKLTAGRPEPILYPVWSGAGYPSGHVLTAFVLTFLLWRAAGDLGWSDRVRRVLGWATVFYPLLMAVSRVYLNCHYLSDVIGGFLIGLVHLGLVFGLLGAQRQGEARA